MHRGINADADLHNVFERRHFTAAARTLRHGSGRRRAPGGDVRATATVDRADYEAVARRLGLQPGEIADAAILRAAVEEVAAMQREAEALESVEVAAIDDAAKDDLADGFEDAIERAPVDIGNPDELADALAAALADRQPPEEVLTPAVFAARLSEVLENVLRDPDDPLPVRVVDE
jgi:hypothetical protein